MHRSPNDREGVAGQRRRGLLRYLFGPGRANEHTDPHLVASWDGGSPDRWEPPVARGRRDLRWLTARLSDALAALPVPVDRPVWHCALRAAPGDRRLSDAEWAGLARDVVARTGLRRGGDDPGCRWVAVRHADDHVQVVVVLAREDARAVRLWRDFYAVGEAC